MKKKILITYGNPYSLNGTLLPIIPRLSDLFDIVLMTTNYYLSNDLLIKFEAWKRDGIIIDYLIVPMFLNNATQIQTKLKIHFFMLSKIKYLKEQKFDILLGDSSIHIWERYVIECAVDKNCPRLGFNVGLPLVLNPKIMQNIINGNLTSDQISNVDPYSSFLLDQKGEYHSKEKINPRQLSELMNIRVLLKYIQKGISFITNMVSRIFNYNKVKPIFDRYIIPVFVVYKIFPSGKYDLCTQFDTDSFNTVIVFRKQAECFLNVFYKNKRIILAQHPLTGICKCNLKHEEFDAVLVCLGSYIGLEIQNELLLRDLKIVMENSDIKAAHIRPHPGWKGPHLKILLDYLRVNGINAIIVETNNPIWEIVCNYKGVVGYASLALLEARAACNYAFVVGFVAVSRTFVTDPKYYLGDIESSDMLIDWIEDDGSYNPDIFTRHYHPPSEYPSIIEIIRKMTEIS